MTNISNIYNVIQEDPETFFQKLLEGTDHVVRKVGSDTWRIEPCVYCGHNDCLSFSKQFPGTACFSCKGSGNYYSLATKILGNSDLAISFLENYTGQKIQFTEVDERQEKINEIRNHAANFFHGKLMNSAKYLEYLTQIRKHQVETIKIFKIGKSEGQAELNSKLKELGFDDDILKEAKIYIPEGLFVYPYYDKAGNIIRFNTKNRFGVVNRDGVEIKGFSTGPKSLYLSPLVNEDEVVIVEGEHDALSILEEGYTSVVATGGSISDSQINELRRFKKIYMIFDNDDAGRGYCEKLNTELPEIEIYKIAFNTEYKDIDEYLKSDNEVDFNDLIKTAVALDNENYTVFQKGNKITFKNRRYTAEFLVKELKKEIYSGSFKYIKDGQILEHKLNVAVDKIGKKFIEFVGPLYDSINQYYNSDLEKKDMRDLISIYEFSTKKHEIIKCIAEKIATMSDSDKEEVLDYIKEILGQNKVELVLRELNQIANKDIDPYKNFTPITVGQAYDLEGLKAYFYFNLIKVEGEDMDTIRRIPALLCSDRRIIRLDHFVRKDTQCLIILDNVFELPIEIPNALMDDEICSLNHLNAMKYKDGEIKKEDVSIVGILDQLVKYIMETYYLDDPNLFKVVSLFILSTYFYQLFGETPYLFLNGEKGSGKSALSKVLSIFCFNSKYTGSITEASLFRSISIEGGTFVLDEMESLTTRDKAADSGMATVLKSGYTKDGGYAMRYNMEKNCVDKFSTFAPKIIANIFGIEDVILDRCIKVPVKKYDLSLTQNKKSIKDFAVKKRDEIKDFTSSMVFAAMLNFEEVYEKFITVKVAGVSSRSAQILKPLWTLAELAGEDYVRAIKEYYQTYVISEKDYLDASNPEGILKMIIDKIATDYSDRGRTNILIESNICDDYCTKINKYEFEINTFALKLLMDASSGNKFFSMAEIHQLVKRVYPDMNLCANNRTMLSFKSNFDLVAQLRRTSISAYKLKFKIPSNKEVVVLTDDFLMNKPIDEAERVERVEELTRNLY